MKRVPIPGLVVAAIYTACAMVVVVLNGTAPFDFMLRVLTGLVVLPAILAAHLLGIYFNRHDNASMASAILFCAVLFYLLGWFIATVIRFLRRVL